MATYYIQVEEEAWKCPKHPYIVKRRRRHYNGVCPACLHDRLVGLCPGNATSSSSSSSDNSSFSSSSSTEPSFLRRSRSLAAKTPASFLSVLRRSTSKTTERNKSEATEAAVVDRDEEERAISTEQDERIEEFARMITRSRSVSTGMTMMTSGLGRADVAESSSREKPKSSSLFRGLPSPMRLFRGSKIRTPKVAV